MEKVLIKITVILLLVLSIMSCNHHEKIIEDSKYVFDNEDFVNLSDKNVEGINSLFKLMKDSINTFIPLNMKEAYWTKISNGEREKVYYEWMNDCIKLSLSLRDSIIISQNEVLRAKLFEIISKVDTSNFNYLKVCNYGPSKKPTIQYRIKNGKVKGEYSYHFVMHMISNNESTESKYKIENVDEGYVKMKELGDGVYYRIYVSPEVGF